MGTAEKAESEIQEVCWVHHLANRYMKRRTKMTLALFLHHIGIMLSDMGEIGDATQFYEVFGNAFIEVSARVDRTHHNLGLAGLLEK